MNAAPFDTFIKRLPETGSVVAAVLAEVTVLSKPASVTAALTAAFAAALSVPAIAAIILDELTPAGGMTVYDTLTAPDESTTMEPITT
jgi:hypothetical protein